MRTAWIGIVLAAGAFTGCAGPSDGGASGRTAVIHGRVTLGPQCPVQQEGSPCPTTPPAKTVVIATPQGGSGDAGSVRTSTRPDGTFRIAVQPGTYIVTSDAGMRCMPKTVQAGSTSGRAVVIACDTGIR